MNTKLQQEGVQSFTRSDSSMVDEYDNPDREYEIAMTSSDSSMVDEYYPG